MQTAVGNTTGYVNYVYNLQAKGTAQVTSQIMGMSGLVGSTLGQLAFQTSAYLTEVESAAMSFGIVATAGLYKATKQALQFDYAMQGVQAIAGQNNIGDLGEQAMAMSNKFGVAVDQMIEGLESLARAGVSPSNMKGILEEAMGLSKLEAIDLNTAVNSLISTTNLLDTQGLDLESPEYVEALRYQNQKITATSEAAPINAQDIIHTLEHVGGYASSTNIDQDDLYAVIAQLGAKGTKGEIAGTSLRAFLAAGQKDTAQRALKRIGLDVSDLWKNDEQILSISDMKDVLDQAMEAKGYTKQEKLEFYSDFAGYKQANQIMKIDTTSVREFKDKIDRSWDVGKKIDTILGTTQANLQSILQTGINLVTTVGQPLMKMANVILIPLKMAMGVIDFAVNKIPGMKWVAAGTLFMVAVKGLSTVFNKVAPTLGLMVLNFSNVSSYAKDTRDALMESARIMNVLIGGSANRKDIVDLEKERILSRIDDEDYLNYFIKYEKFDKKNWSKGQLADKVKYMRDSKDVEEQRKMEEIIIADKKKRYEETGDLYTEDKKSNSEILEKRNDILNSLTQEIVGTNNNFKALVETLKGQNEKRANSDGPSEISTLTKEVENVKERLSSVINHLQGGIAVLHGNNEKTIEKFDTVIANTNKIVSAISTLKNNVYTVRLEGDGNVKFSPDSDFDIDFDYSYLDTINNTLEAGFDKVIKALQGKNSNKKETTTTKTKRRKRRGSSGATTLDDFDAQPSSDVLHMPKTQFIVEVDEPEIDLSGVSSTDKGGIPQEMIDLVQSDLEKQVADAIKDANVAGSIGSGKRKPTYKLPKFKGVKLNDLINLRSSDREKQLNEISKWLNTVRTELASLKDKFEDEVEYQNFVAEQYYDAFSVIEAYDLTSFLETGLLDETKASSNRFTGHFIEMQDVIRKSKRFNNADPRRMLKGGERFSAVKVRGSKGASEYFEPYTVQHVDNDFGEYNALEYGANNYERSLDTNHSRQSIMGIRYSNEANSIGGFQYRNGIGEQSTYNAIDIIPEQMYIEVAEGVEGELYNLIQQHADKLLYLQQHGDRTKLPVDYSGAVITKQQIENKINQLKNSLEAKTIDMANILEKTKEQPILTNEIVELVDELTPEFIDLVTMGLRDKNGNALNTLTFIDTNNQEQTISTHIKKAFKDSTGTLHKKTYDEVRGEFKGLLGHQEFLESVSDSLGSFYGNSYVKDILNINEKVGDVNLFSAIKDNFKGNKLVKGDLLSTLFAFYRAGDEELVQLQNVAQKVENSNKDIIAIQKDMQDFANENNTEELSYDDTYSSFEEDAFTDTSYRTDVNRKFDNNIFGGKEEPSTNLYVDQLTGALSEALRSHPGKTIANLDYVKAKYGESTLVILSQIAELDRQHKMLTEIEAIINSGQIIFDTPIGYKNGEIDWSTVTEKHIQQIYGSLIKQPMSNKHIAPGTIEGKNQSFGAIKEDNVIKTIQDAQAVEASYNNAVSYLKGYDDIQWKDPNDDTDYTPNVVKKRSLMSIFRSSVRPDIVSASKATPGTGGEEEGWRKMYVETKYGTYSYIDQAEMMTDIPEGKQFSKKKKPAEQYSLQSDFLGQKALEYIQLNNQIEKKIENRKNKRKVLEEQLEEGTINYNEYLDELAELEKEDEKAEEEIEKLLKAQNTIQEKVLSASGGDFDFSNADDLAYAIDLGVAKGKEVIPGLFVRTAGAFGEMHNGDPFKRNKKGEIIGIKHDAHNRFSEIFTSELEKKRFSERLKSKNRLNAGFLAGNFGFTQTDIANMKLSTRTEEAIHADFLNQEFQGINLERYKTDKAYKQEIDDMYQRMSIMNYSKPGAPKGTPDKNLFTKKVDRKTFEELRRNNMLLPQDIAAHTDENGKLLGGQNGWYEIFDLSLLQYSEKDLRNAAVMNLLSQDLMLQENTALMEDQEWVNKGLHKNLTLNEIFNVDHDGNIIPSNKGSIFLFDVMNKGFANTGFELTKFLNKDGNEQRFMANMVNNPELLKTLKEQSQIRIDELKTKKQALTDNIALIFDKVNNGGKLTQNDLEVLNSADNFFNIYKTELGIEKELQQTFSHIDDLAFIRAQYENDPKFLQQLQESGLVQDDLSKYNNLEEYIRHKTLSKEANIQAQTTSQNEENKRRRKIDRKISNQIWSPFDKLFTSKNGAVFFNKKHFKNISSLDDFKEFVLGQKMHQGRQKNEADKEQVVKDFFAQRQSMIKKHIFKIFKQDLGAQNATMFLSDEEIMNWVDDWMEDHDEWEQVYFMYEFFVNQQNEYDKNGIIPDNIADLIGIEAQQRKIKEMMKNLNKVQKKKILQDLGIKNLDKFLNNITDKDKLNSITNHIEKAVFHEGQMASMYQNLRKFKESDFINQILSKKSISNQDKINLIARRLSGTTLESGVDLSDMNNIFQNLSPKQQKEVLQSFSNNSLAQQALIMAMMNPDIGDTSYNKIDLYNNAQELPIGFIYAAGNFSDKDIRKSKYKKDGKNGKAGDLKIQKDQEGLWGTESVDKLRYEYLNLFDEIDRLEFYKSISSPENRQNIQQEISNIEKDIALIEKLMGTSSKASYTQTSDDPIYEELNQKALEIKNFRELFERIYKEGYVPTSNNKGNPTPVAKYTKERIKNIEKFIGTDLRNIFGNIEDKELLQQAEEYGQEQLNQIIKEYFSVPWDDIVKEAAEEVETIYGPELKRIDNDKFLATVQTEAQKRFMDNTIAGLTALQEIIPFVNEKPEILLSHIPRENIAFDFNLLSREEFNRANGKYINYNSYEEYLRANTSGFKNARSVGAILGDTVNKKENIENKKEEERKKESPKPNSSHTSSETIKNAQKAAQILSGNNTIDDDINTDSSEYNIKDEMEKQIGKSNEYNKLTEWLETFKENFNKKFQIATQKVFGHFTDEGFQQSSLFGGLRYDLQATKLNKASASLQSNITWLKQWREALIQVAGESTLLQIPLDAIALILTPIIVGMETFSRVANGLLSIVTKAKELEMYQATTIFNKPYSADSGVGQIIGSVGGAIEPIGELIDGFLVKYIVPLIPYITALGIALFGIKQALDWSFKSHEKYLKQLQEEEKENKSRSKALQTLTEKSRKTHDDKYELNRLKLSNANLTRTTGAIKLTNEENDMLWGKYGIASALDKMQGKYESTAEEYDGTSGQIRRIKEHTTGGQGLIRGMPGYYSEAEAMVAAYYDANKLAIGVMDEYKDELGELYDAETNAMRRHPDENPRETREFQIALDKFVEATGITRDHAQQYLDYMQTEHNVDNAVQAMQAQADMITAQTDMAIQAIAFGGNPSDVLGLNGIEAQQNAMVKAQADMIKLEISSQLWWKAVWSTITSPIRAIISPIFAIAHILGAIWSAITGNWDAAGMHMQQAGSSLNVLGETATYWGAWGTAEATDFNSIGQGAIDENDRANYGNATTGQSPGVMNAKNPNSNAILGFHPVGWPFAKQGAHGVKDHKETLAKNAQETFFGKLIGGITSLLVGILSVVSIIAAGKGLQLLWNNSYVQKAIGKITSYLPGIKDKVTNFIDNHENVKKVLGYGKTVGKIFGLDKAKNFIGQYIPQDWKDTWHDLWNKKEENIAEEEIEEDKPIEDNVNSIADNIRNIWNWISKHNPIFNKQNKKDNWYDELIKKDFDDWTDEDDNRTDDWDDKQWDDFYSDKIKYEELQHINKQKQYVTDQSLWNAMQNGEFKPFNMYDTYEIERLRFLEEINPERYQKILDDYNFLPLAENMEEQVTRFLENGDILFGGKKGDAVGEAFGSIRQFVLYSNLLSTMDEETKFNRGDIQNTIWHELAHISLHHDQRHNEGIDESDPVQYDSNYGYEARISEFEARLVSLLTMAKMQGIDINAADIINGTDKYKEAKEQFPGNMSVAAFDLMLSHGKIEKERPEALDNLYLEMYDNLSDAFVTHKDDIMKKIHLAAASTSNINDLVGFNYDDSNMYHKPISVQEKLANFISNINPSIEDRRPYNYRNDAYPGYQVGLENWNTYDNEDNYVRAFHEYIRGSVGYNPFNSVPLGYASPSDIYQNYDGNNGMPLITYGDLSNTLSNYIQSSNGLWEDSILYHGYNLSDGKEEDLNYNQNSAIGSFNHFISSSFSKSMAEEFGSSGMVKIYAPQGTKGLYQKHEDEFLMDEQQEFAILDRNKETGRPTEILLLTQELMANLGVTVDELNQAISQGFDVKSYMAQKQMLESISAPNQSIPNPNVPIDDDTNVYTSPLESQIPKIPTDDLIYKGVETLPFASLMPADTKKSWSGYLSEKVHGFTDPWSNYLTQKTNSFLGISDEDKETFSKKKRKGMNKEERAYLNEKYDLGLDLDDFRTSKQANKAVRDKLDENEQWDTAMNDLHSGGLRRHQIKNTIKNNYVEPWKEYGKNKASQWMTEAELYNQNPTYMGQQIYDKENASMPVKVLAKGMEIKDKWAAKIGMNSTGNLGDLKEAFEDPEKMEEYLKARLDSFDSESTIGQYRDKAYKAKEIISDPEKTMQWMQNKYYNGLDQGQEEYQWYQGGELAYDQLSIPNKIRHMKEQVLGMSGEESFADLLQDPERTVEVAQRGYAAFQEGGLNGLLGANEDYDIAGPVKDKVAELFGKIKEGAEEGIEDEDGGEGGSGGLIQKAKEKLAGIFGEDTSPVTKEEIEEKQESGDFKTVSDWKSEKMAEIQEGKGESLSNRIKNKISNIFGSGEESPLSNIGKMSNMDIEGQDALANSGLLGGQRGIGVGQTFVEGSPGATAESPSIMDLDELNPSKALSKGGKGLSKIGKTLSGKGGKLGKVGKVMSKVGGGASKLGKGGIGKGLGKIGGKLGKGGIGKGLGKVGGKIGGKIMGKVGGKIAGKVGAQVASKVLAGGLAATGIGAPLAAIMASPIGGFLMEGAMNLGGKALGAIGGAIGGIGKAIFGGPKLPGQQGGGGLLGGLMAASPLGMLAGAAGGLLGSVFGGGGPKNMGKMGATALKAVGAPLGGMVGMLGKIFSNDKQTKSLNEKIEAHTGKTLDAVREQNAKSTPSANNSGGNITIQNININTADDPEAIKAMFLELIVELQEQVNPRLVSRTAGKAPESSSSTTDNTSTDDTSTDKSNATVGEGTTTSSGNQTNNTN